MTTDVPPGGGWETYAQAPSPKGPAAGLEYATAWRRLAAWLIDLVILGIPGYAISTVIMFSGDFYDRMYQWMLDYQASPFNVSPFGWMDPGWLIWSAIATQLVSAVYFVTCWRFLRGSLGQRMLGVLLGNEADGAPLDLLRCLARWIVLSLGPFYLPFLLLPLEGMLIASSLVALAIVAWQVVLLVTVAVSPTGQGLHDRLVNSLVVRRL